ncbi:MAG TPA: hypothetical protein VJ184_13185, partial [Chryseolinea sp.]|nr:hypothetical protein [Chryseolinea sp.]
NPKTRQSMERASMVELVLVVIFFIKLTAYSKQLTAGRRLIKFSSQMKDVQFAFRIQQAVEARGIGKFLRFT